MFDPLTGEINPESPAVDGFSQIPLRYTPERMLETIEKVKVELDQRFAVFEENNFLVEAQRLMQRTQFDLEMMAQLGYCTGVENYSRYLSDERRGSHHLRFFDYLPMMPLWFIDESHVTVPQIGAMYKGDRSRKETLVDYGFRLPSAH